MSDLHSKLGRELQIRLVVTSILAVSSAWLLIHALLDSAGYEPAVSFFNYPSAEVVRIALGVAGIVATGLQAYYWKKSIVNKTDLKLAINHYVRNRTQFLLMAIELYNMDPSQENLATLFKAREETLQLVKEVDLIVQDKLHAPPANNVANIIKS
ncbi:MAG TPA: hypothetical protein VFF30_19605 [Nitrososphaerales archaeon]|nr:hypothetical protein [Nitrososphaerales archaeon]